MSEMLPGLGFKSPSGHKKLPQMLGFLLAGHHQGTARVRDESKMTTTNQAERRLTWPICTTLQPTHQTCRHSIRHPSVEALTEAARAHKAAWVDDEGNATCVCHNGDGFPCDEATK